MMKVNMHYLWKIDTSTKLVYLGSLFTTRRWTSYSTLCFSESSRGT